MNKNKKTKNFGEKIFRKVTTKSKILVITMFMSLAFATFMYIAIIHEANITIPAYQPTENTSTFSSVSSTSATTTISTSTTFTKVKDNDSYKFSADDRYLMASLVSQEVGSTDYINPFRVDNNFNLYEVSDDLTQQCIAKILVNQMRYLGYSSIRETLANSTQFENSLENFDNSDNTIESFDKRVLNNVDIVIMGKSSVPDSILYERCTNTDIPEEYTHDIVEAYGFMQSEYPQELDVYMFSMNSDGSWWMACSIANN